MNFNGFRLNLMDFDFFGACRTPKELVERPKELVERPKCTKESPRKGIHKGGRAPKAPAPLCGGGRRPPPFMGLVLCIFGLLGNQNGTKMEPKFDQWNQNGTRMEREYQIIQVFFSKKGSHELPSNLPTSLNLVPDD